MPVTETAYAKINLGLHVRRRREDGYHDIETLFAFVDAGDVLTAKPAEQDTLHITGEFAEGLNPPFGNLAIKALGKLPRPTGLELLLDKRLPIAAGLGGGSADAGAVFRIVEEYHGLPEDWQTRAASLGADVPACVRSEMAIGRGNGTKMESVANDLTGTPVLLVNPRISLGTADVYGAWDGQDRGALPSGSAREIAKVARNDLRDPAIGLCPIISDVLDALAHSDAWQSDMSGSGATCYALFDRVEARDAASAAIETDRPDWWQMRGRLR